MPDSISTSVALFLRTFWGLAHTGPGFDAAHVLEFVVDSPAAEFVENLEAPGYFDAMGIPLLRGRNIAASDVKKGPQPIVVNRAFARAFFPGHDAIGKVLVGWTDRTNQTWAKASISDLPPNTSAVR